MKTTDKKAFFFDFDGTIWFGEFGQKTLKALRDLHKKGHLLFYNSGRSKGNSRFDRLGEIPFDGFLYGGCHAEAFGKQIYRKDLSKEAIFEALAVEREFGLLNVYEGVKGVYKRQNPELAKFYGEDLDDISVLQDTEKYPLSKFSIIKERSGEEYTPISQEAIKRLEKYFDVVDLDGYLECMQKGTGKDFIIEKTLKSLEIDKKDTFGFGDSLNDLPMFKVCAKNVAIGHSPSELKKHAVYVTKEEQNGVWEALRHMGFVE